VLFHFLLWWGAHCVSDVVLAHGLFLRVSHIRRRTWRSPTLSPRLSLLCGGQCIPLCARLRFGLCVGVSVSLCSLRSGHSGTFRLLRLAFGDCIMGLSIVEALAKQLGVAFGGSGHPRRVLLLLRLVR